MMENDYFVSFSAGPYGTLLSSRRVEPAPRRPFSLVTADLKRYDLAFRVFRFYEVANIRDVAEIDEPNLEEEPECELATVAGQDRKIALRVLVSWLAWFTCQPTTKKLEHMSKARAIGDALLAVLECPERRADLNEEPHEPYRCGTILMGLSNEDRAAWHGVWDAEDLCWLAWYAQRGDFADEQLEARARKKGLALCMAHEHTRPGTTTVCFSPNFTVVEDEATKSAMLATIEQARTARDPEGRRLHPSLFEAVTSSISSLRKAIPFPPITRVEFDARNSRFVRPPPAQHF